MVHDRMQLGRYIIGTSFRKEAIGYYRKDSFIFKDETIRHEHEIIVLDKLDNSDLAVISSDSVLKSNITYSKDCVACLYNESHSVRYHNFMLRKRDQNCI